MKIVKVEVGLLNIPLIKPFKTALRTVFSIEDILVKIYTNCNKIGLGEASPTAQITGETTGSICMAIEKFIAPSIIGIEIEEIEEIMSRIQNCIQGNYSAKASVDMAIYDLYAKNLEKPLYKILGGAKSYLKTDITISLNSIEEMIADSLRAVSQGYTILKIKVGKEGKQDIEKISEIRKAVGKDISIRVDANQGWSAKEAVSIIRMLEDKDLSIELIEQPVPAYDLKGLQYVTKHSFIPILADESIFSAKDAIRILEMRAADFINIKLMKAGGIYQALKICTIAQIYQIECMMGCMLESRLAVSAAAHLAAAKKVITKVDLDGPAFCALDPFSKGPVFSSCIISMTEEIGIGIEERKIDKGEKNDIF